MEDKKIAFAFWQVKGESYKCKLKTAGVIELENRYNKSLLSIISGEMPPLTVMLQIMHTAMQPWKHNITLKDVYNLFDAYTEENGSQIEFYTGPFMEMCKVSGFFPKKLNQENSQENSQEDNPEDNPEESWEE